MVLKVGIFFVGLAFDKSSCFKMVGRSGSFPSEKPVKSNLGCAPRAQIGVFTDGFFTFPLNVHFEMILQICTDGRQVMDDIDPMIFKLVGIAHAGELKNLRGIDSPSTEDDLPSGGHTAYFSSFFKFYTDRFFPFKKYFMHHSPGHYCQIRAIFRSEEHTSELQSRGHLVCRL